MDPVSPSSMPTDLHFNGAVDPLEEERARLETDIAVAKARLFAAKHAAAELDAQTKQALRAELALSRDDLAALETQHADSVRAIRQQASDEVDRIRADARRQAADIDARSLAAESQVVS
jgi:hypothetical protein